MEPYGNFKKMQVLKSKFSFCSWEGLWEKSHEIAILANRTVKKKKNLKTNWIQ